jgi:hypothetical protein
MPPKPRLTAGIKVLNIAPSRGLKPDLPIKTEIASPVNERLGNIQSRRVAAPALHPTRQPIGSIAPAPAFLALRAATLCDLACGRISMPIFMSMSMITSGTGEPSIIIGMPAPIMAM